MIIRKLSAAVSVLGILSGCAQDAPNAQTAASEEPQPVLEQDIGTIIGIWAAAEWFGNQRDRSQDGNQGQSWWERWNGGSAQSASSLKEIGFGSIGGDAASSPAITSWGEGRLDVFVRGSSGALYHRAYEKGGSNWEELGGTAEGDPAAASWGAGRIDVFVRGSDNALWQRTYDEGRWRTWASLGGSLGSGPAVASMGAGMLDVVARSSTGGVVHRAFRDGRWGEWQRLDGNITSDPALAAADGRLHLVARGGDGTLYYRRNETGWSSWQSVPGTAVVQGSPALAASSNGRLDAFARGGDGALWTATYANNRWGSVRRIGGAIVESPDAVRSALGRIDVVVTGSDRAVYHRFFSFQEAAGPGDEEESGWGDENKADDNNRPGI